MIKVNDTLHSIAMRGWRCTVVAVGSKNITVAPNDRMSRVNEYEPGYTFKIPVKSYEEAKTYWVKETELQRAVHNKQTDNINASSF